MTQESKQAVAIVTGAGRGIGKAVALALAKAGYAIALSARTASEIQQVAAEIKSAGGEAIAVTGDIASESDVSQLVAGVLKQYDRIDVLINNAGIGAFAPVVDLGVSDWDRMFSTNVRGLFLASKAVLPTMLKQNTGDIINLASLAGRNSFRGGAGYSATKWAVIGFARSLMLEVRDHNIRVVTICPGSVDTTFDPTGKVRTNADRIPKAGDIAQIVMDVLRMPRHVMISEIDVRPTNP